MQTHTGPPMDHTQFPLNDPPILSFILWSQGQCMPRSCHKLYLYQLRSW